MKHCASYFKESVSIPPKMPYNDSVMKLIELLEKNKENLLTEIASAKKADKAIRILENELDRLLITYNESCRSEREQDAAARMLQAVRLSLPLIDSSGETKVWESEGAGAGKSRINPLGFIFIAAALVLCGFGLVPLIIASGAAESAGEAGKDPDLLRIIGLELGGLAAAVVAGLLLRRPARKEEKRSRHVETSIDAGKIYRSFRNAILSVDQNLDEIRSQERWNSRSEAGTIDGREISSSELDLFSDLLAAAYSGDPEYALEKIENIKYFLHRQQIEAVDYSSETAQYFDMMPGQFAGTIRPALVADGSLLRKGIASAGTK